MVSEKEKVMLTKNIISNMYGQPAPHQRTLADTSGHVGLPPIKNQHVSNLSEISGGLQVRWFLFDILIKDFAFRFWSVPRGQDICCPLWC